MIAWRDGYLSFARPRSLSFGENRSGVKTPALFLVQRPTERYNLSTRFELLSLSLPLSRSFIDAGVRHRPDVRSGPGPKLTGSCREHIRFAGGSSLNITVHQSLPPQSRESTGCFPSLVFSFLLYILLSN